MKLTEVNKEFADLPKIGISYDPFIYMLEVYMDNYIVLATPRSWYQLHHISNAVIKAIQDVLPTDKDDDEDAISLKKIIKKEGVWLVVQNVLGFEFDGNPGEHTICLTEYRRTIFSKLRNAFIYILSGKGLLFPCNQVLGKDPKNIFLHRNKTIFLVIRDFRHLLKPPIKIPTPCKELVAGWTHYIRGQGCI